MGTAFEEDIAPGDLVAFCYTSRSRRSLGAAAFERLWRRASRRNGLHGITSGLLRDGGRFLQVLEGPAGEVYALAAGIARDERHGDVRVLWDGPVAERCFARRPLRLLDLDAPSVPTAGAGELLDDLLAAGPSPELPWRLGRVLDGGRGGHAPAASSAAG